MNTYSKISTSRRRAQHPFNKKALALGISLALGAGAAHAVESGVVCNPFTDSISDTGGNFTMLRQDGTLEGGTNDLVFTWEGTMFNNSSDYTGIGSNSNATIRSNELFSGNIWTAHDVQVFTQGSYSFDTSTGGGGLESGMMGLTVGSGQLGMHMLFDWSSTRNIDVVLVLNKTQVFGTGTSSFDTGTTACANSLLNCLYTDGPATSFAGGTKANRPAGNKVWMLASVDQAGGDSISGTRMAAGGPFQFFNANFNFNGTLTPADGVCGPNTDTLPDPFDLGTEITGAAFNTTFVADAMFTPPSGPPSTALSGLGTNVTVPISISGTGNPQYALNGGTTWFSSTDPAGTVQNGSTVKVRVTSGPANGSVVTASLSIGGITDSFVVKTPAAGKVIGSNFTMNTSTNGIQGGANDVVVKDWNFSTPNNTTSTGIDTGNIIAMKLSSATKFSSSFWTAHDIRVFNPGSYTFNTGCTGAELRADGGQNCAISGPTLSMTVGSNQLGGHMLFDWNGTYNIDVAMVWDRNKKFGPSPMYVGECGNSNTEWDLTSADHDGNGYNGIPMLAVDSPFPGFYANFNIKLGPVTGVAGDCSPPSIEAEDTNISKGAGCTLSPTPVNPLERGDWWLLLSFLGWMGFRAKRKRA